MKPARRFRVLIVDDDPALLKTAKAILSNDFDVTACSTPEEALDCFDAEVFDVVCADYLMPGTDGAKFLEEIHNRSDVVCCLLMTGRVDLDMRDRSFLIIFKPFSPDRFIHLISHLARLTAMKRSTRALVRETKD